MSVAIGYAIMIGVVSLAAAIAPPFAFGWSSITNWIPLLLTALGLGSWLALAYVRSVKDDLDPTVDYYNRNADDYAAKISNIDMSDCIDKFTAMLPPDADVLDVGAAAGRDSRALLAKGFRVRALEPSRAFVKRLRTISGLEVVEGRAQEVGEVAVFDGIWACASLLHLDEDQLSVAMTRLRCALRPGGVFFLCFKDGEGTRTLSVGRFFHDMSKGELAELARIHGLSIMAEWSDEPYFRNSNETPWNNLIAKKP